MSRSSSKSGPPPGESAGEQRQGWLGGARRFLAGNRRSAAIALGLILVAFVTASAVGLLQWRQAEEEDSAARIFERAEIAADQLEGFLISASPALGASIAQTIDEEGELSAELGIDGEAWALNRGADVVGATTAQPLGLPAEARSAVFAEGFAVSGLIEGGGRARAIRVGIPLSGGGPVVAVVATVPAKFLAGFVGPAIERIPLTPSGQVAVLGPDGRALASTGLDPSLGPELVAASREAPAGEIELDGSKQLYSAAVIADSPWTMVLAAPEDEVLATAGGPAGWIGWALLAEVVLAALLGILLVTRLLRDAERVDRANAALSERSASAELATENKDGFISTMAHEMRTPLAAVSLFAEMMRTDEQEPLAPNQRRRATDIASSTRHVLDLLDDTVDLARVESGRLELRPERVSIAAIAVGVVDGLHPLALDRGLELTLEADGKLGQVFLDPARVRQVMINFLSNALKFTPAQGRVRMRVERHGDDSFEIAVDDTGVGIAADAVGEVFSASRRPTAPLHSQETSGLGLVVTKRLVEVMGGAVSVRSRPGRGSTFTAVLPRVSAERRGRLEIPQQEEPEPIG